MLIDFSPLPTGLELLLKESCNQDKERGTADKGGK